MTDAERVVVPFQGKASEMLNEAARSALSHGGGGGTYDGMEARVAKLEADVAHLSRDVGELRIDMKDVRDRLIGVEKTMATRGFVVTVYLVGSSVLAAVVLFQQQIQSFIGNSVPTP